MQRVSAGSLCILLCGSNRSRSIQLFYFTSSSLPIVLFGRRSAFCVSSVSALCRGSEKKTNRPTFSPDDFDDATAVRNSHSHDRSVSCSQHIFHHQRSKGEFPLMCIRRQRGIIYVISKKESEELFFFELRRATGDGQGATEPFRNSESSREANDAEFLFFFFVVDCNRLGTSS